MYENTARKLTSLIQLGFRDLFYFYDGPPPIELQVFANCFRWEVCDEDRQLGLFVKRCQNKLKN